MRKISQVALLFVSITSLLCFLVYKHKYEKIATVLRVLNTFGCQSECDSSSPVTGPNIARTMSTWQQIDEIYVYSAYWQFEHEYAVVLGLATNTAKMSVTCLLWTEGDDEPLIGVFTRFSSPINDTYTSGEQFVSTLFQCKTDVAVKHVPYAVSLASDDRFQATKSSAFIYVQALRKFPSLQDKVSEARFAVCVLPQRDQSQSPQLLKEFIRYHAAIGYNRFVIYDSGTSPDQVAQWRIASDSNPVAFEFLPWNVPYLARHKLEDAALQVLQQDCIRRLMRTHSHVSLQRVNQFVVPRHHTSIGEFLAEEERASENALGALVLEERHFCTDFRGFHSDDPMIVRFALWVPSSSKDVANPVYAFIRTDAFHSFWESGEPRFRVGYSVRKVHSSIANFHYYGPCLTGMSTDYAAVIFQKSKEDLIMSNFLSRLNY